MGYLSIPTIPERDLNDITIADVDELRAVKTDGKSVNLPIENLSVNGTKVPISIVGIVATNAQDGISELKGIADTLGTEKVSTTTQVIAGNGLTGGGALSSNVTLNVAATDDSIVVAADSIKVDTVDTLVSTSTTKPLSANQGRALSVSKANDNAVVHLTGNETVAGIKTFSSSPVVPTPTTDMQAATKKYGDDILAAYNVDINNVCGAVNHYKRVIADSGGIFDRTYLLKAYTEYIKQRPETVRLYMPELGAKLRTSGLNRYGVKAYDLSTNKKDAVQLTDATQPYMTVGAAPNARLGMRFVQGQTQTGLMDFDDVAFQAADTWTLTVRTKANSYGRIYISTTVSIILGAGGTVLDVGGIQILSSATPVNRSIANTIEFQYSNGAGVILVNTKPIATTPVSSLIVFGQISYNSTYPFDGALYAFHLTNTRKSAYQSQLDHAFLSLLFPDMESVTIGYQVWSTDNFCGTVAGDGTVINEVQGATTDGNAELFTSTWLDAVTGWNVGTGWSVGGGLASSDGSQSASSIIYRIVSSLVVGKLYRITYTISNYSAGSVFLLVGDSAQTPAKTANGTYTDYVKCAGNLLIGIQANADFVGSIGLVSYKEVGASDSTLVYNYVYSATSGTAAVKDLAATKAAAMWCHYDNLAANGAVYGKLYNWYAVHLFDLYPPVKGCRIPSKLDLDQLVANQGGSTVAGGKLKAKFGGFNNANANNESGLSATPAYYRSETGAFYAAAVSSHFFTSDTGRYFAIDYDASFTKVSDANPASMCSIRLLRNEPAGNNELSYTSGLFTTDITSAAKQIPISFGRMVDAIRIKSENALTAIEAKLHNAAGTAVATLITGKTIGAGETKMFSVNADWVSLLQDGTVRVTAAGNSGAAVGMEIEVITHKGVLS